MQFIIYKEQTRAHHICMYHNWNQTKNKKIALVSVCLLCISMFVHFQHPAGCASAHGCNDCRPAKGGANGADGCDACGGGGPNPLLNASACSDSIKRLAAWRSASRSSAVWRLKLEKKRNKMKQN